MQWLWQKLSWFLSGPGFAGRLGMLVDELEAHGPGDELLAESLVLFQDGVVDDFLRLRGPLLPDDEHNLVSQWALVERSVFEVVAVERGAGLTFRDIRSGEVVDVRERLGSTQLAPGQVLCAHVVPVGVGHQVVGGITSVPLRLRDPLVAALDAKADGLEVAGLIAAASAPAELRTTEGEPVVICEARYRIGDRAAIGALDGLLDRDGETTWSQSVEVDGRTWVRGTVSIAGSELVVLANSEARFRRLRSLVEAAVPGLALVAEKATPSAELLAAAAARPSPAAVSEEVSPGMAEALAAFIRQQEDRWVDEPVPALGGVTPRQAAADPTRREQLVALLREFDREPTPRGSATFDTDRLRAKLGLDT